MQPKWVHEISIVTMATVLSILFTIKMSQNTSQQLPRLLVILKVARIVDVVGWKADIPRFMANYRAIFIHIKFKEFRNGDGFHMKQPQKIKISVLCSSRMVWIVESLVLKSSLGGILSLSKNGSYMNLVYKYMTHKSDVCSKVSEMLLQFINVT